MLTTPTSAAASKIFFLDKLLWVRGISVAAAFASVVAPGFSVFSILVRAMVSLESEF